MLDCKIDPPAKKKQIEAEGCWKGLRQIFPRVSANASPKKRKTRLFILWVSPDQLVSAEGHLVCQITTGLYHNTPGTKLAEKLTQMHCHMKARIVDNIVESRVTHKERLMVSRRTTAVADTRAKLSDNARKLFDLAMQSGEFKKMMVMGMGFGAVLASIRF